MVSIIVPVYNAVSSLPRCIESILNQSYNDLEILLVNDGSIDRSLDICLQYASLDNRIKVLNKENGGAASARNEGLDYCMGDYVMFVDSDDYIETDLVEKAIVLQASNKLDWVIYGFKFLSKRGTRVLAYKKGIYSSTSQIISLIEHYFEHVIIHSCCNKLYRRDLISNIRMQNGFVYGEDFYFNLHYMRNVESIGVIDDTFYVYDCTKESVTRSNYKCKRQDFDIQYKFALNLFENKFLSASVVSVICRVYLDHIISHFIYTHNFKSIRNITVKDYFHPYQKYALKVLQPNKLYLMLAGSEYNKLTCTLSCRKIKQMLKNQILLLLSKIK